MTRVQEEEAPGEPERLLSHQTSYAWVRRRMWPGRLQARRARRARRCRWQRWRRAWRRSGRAAAARATRPRPRAARRSRCWLVLRSAQRSCSLCCVRGLRRHSSLQVWSALLCALQQPCQSRCWPGPGVITSEGLQSCQRPVYCHSASTACLCCSKWSRSMRAALETARSVLTEALASRPRWRRCWRPRRRCRRRQSRPWSTRASASAGRHDPTRPTPARPPAPIKMHASPVLYRSAISHPACQAAMRSCTSKIHSFASKPGWPQRFKRV